MRSPARGLLSIAKLKRANSRHRLAICKRIRIAQISLSLNGVFWPTSLPLFQGSRVIVGEFPVSMTGLLMLRRRQSAHNRKYPGQLCKLFLLWRSGLELVYIRIYTILVDISFDAA